MNSEKNDNNTKTNYIPNILPTGGNIFTAYFLR